MEEEAAHRVSAAAHRHETPDPDHTPTRGRLLYGITVADGAQVFLSGQLSYMSSLGWEVFLASSPGSGLERLRDRENVDAIEIPTPRDIHPLQDLRSLLRWLHVIRSIRPDVVNVGTPKAGLLGSLASWALRVPRRVYVVRGLRLESERGWRRRVLMLAERVTIACATDVIAVSHSLAEAMTSMGLASGRELVVLGHGSSNGVDAGGLQRRAAALDRVELRRTNGISHDAFAVAFIGRIRRDKGVLELLQAISDPRLANAVLVTAGSIEEPDVAEQLRALGERWIHLGWVSDVAPVLVACDALCLPSHREGFPNVVLEAAALGRPAVTTDTTGTRDSVVDGETGFVVPPMSPRALSDALVKLAVDPAMRAKMGAAAEQRVRRDFQPQAIWQGLDAVYTSSPRRRNRGTAP